jgi:glycosyltransferase involved in cell wall biosynthesis
MAKAFLEQGFVVDVIGFEDDIFVPRKEYRYFVDVLTNMERLSRHLNEDCIKIFHPCFAHWLFHNHAEYKRLYALQERKGYVLRPRRTLKVNLSVENANYLTVRGDSPYCESTYKYAKKPIFNLTHSSNYTYPWPDDKNFNACKNRFLWLGGKGLIHKGLDLLLEAFAEMPENELLICGGVDDEKDFSQAYHKELHEIPNVKKLGWVDVGSQEFNDIMNSCIGLLHPSASELTSGSVITCMHGGLIPLVSYQSGTSVHDFGIDLGGCTVEEIKGAVRRISGTPASRLEEMSRAAWEYARRIYTRERFKKDYRETLEKIIALH